MRCITEVLNKDQDRSQITVCIVPDNSSFSDVLLATAKLGERMSLYLGHFACVIDNTNSAIVL